MRRAQTACPFRSILIRQDGHDVGSVPLDVSDDEQWTLQASVRLFEEAPSGDTWLFLCDDGGREVLAIRWEKAQHLIDSPGLIPAGTSLLVLISGL